MGRLQKNETPRRAGVDGAETCRVLPFPARPPRPVMADWSSGWYHQAAIEDSSRPTLPKR